MKNKKMTAIVIATALVANAFLLGLAHADDTTSQVEITGGTITMVVPTTMNFAAQDTSAADQDLAVVKSPTAFQIQDLTSDGSTFDVYVNMEGGFTDWSTGQTIPLGASDANVALDIDAADLGWLDLGESGLCASAGMTLQAAVGLDTTGQQVVVSGDTTSRAVNCGAQPKFNITVPGGTLAGTYQSTITWTLTT